MTLCYFLDVFMKVLFRIKCRRKNLYFFFFAVVVSEFRVRCLVSRLHECPLSVTSFVLVIFFYLHIIYILFARNLFG